MESDYKPVFTNDWKKKMSKMSPVVHSSPEYKGVRKMYQGINATTKGSIEKSKRRHNAKQLALNKHKNE